MIRACRYRRISTSRKQGFGIVHALLRQVPTRRVCALDGRPPNNGLNCSSAETGRPSQPLDVTDVGLAINPNDVLLYMPRASAENALGRFDQARADAERAMWLSPRDFLNTTFLMIAGDAD